MPPPEEPGPTDLVPAPAASDESAGPAPLPTTIAPAGAMCGVHPDVPAVATCVRCGTFACSECSKPMPDGRVFCLACHERGAGAIPWEQRKQLGYWKAFWSSTRQVCFSPTRFFQTPQFENGVVPPFFYNTLVQAVAQLGTALGIGCLYGGLGIVLAAAAPPRMQSEANIFLIFAFVFPLVIGVFGILYSPVNAIQSMAIGGGLAHLGLIIVRARNASFESTARAIAYAQAPMAFYAIPVVGWIVAPFWAIATTVIALRETHRTTTWRAMAAFFFLPFVLFTMIGIAVVIVALMIPLMSQR